jgi:hypothetical protein
LSSRSHSLVRGAGAVPLWAAALIAYALLAIVLWLPFGFRMNGLVEEWDISWLLDRGEQLWWITGSSSVSYLRLRPLTMLPFAVAHALGGFVWLNAIALAVLALRGTATFLLIDRLAPRRRSAAWIGGALSMLYPANVGLFALRMTHINLAVTLFLFALVVLCDIERGARRWRMIPMALMLAASLLIYQIALVAAVLGPVVLLVLGVRERRRLLELASAWYLGLACVGVYWLVIVSEGVTYELNSAHGPRPPLRVYGHDLIESYVDQLARAWLPSAWVTWRPAFVAIGIACGLGVAALAWSARRGADRAVRERNTLVAGISLLLIAPIGFLPLWAIVASIHEALKVYLLSSVAVSAGLALLIAYIGRRPEIIAVLGGILAAVAVLYGLQQHAYYASLAHRQERVLGEMVDQLPSPPRGTTIVVHDITGQLGREWTLGPPVTFAAAVSVAYHDPTLQVALCEDESHDAFVNGNSVARCPTAPAQRSRVQHLAVFRYDLLRELRLVTPGDPTLRSLPAGYAPSELAYRGPKMRRGLFSCDPIEKCTDPPSASWPRGSIAEPFDRFALNVTGIFAPEESPAGETFQWSNSHVVRVYAVLPPRRMRFDLHFLYVLRPDVLKTIRLSVDGRTIPVAVSAGRNGYHAIATIPAAALKAQRDTLAITSAVVPVAGSPDALGLAIERLDVRRVG